MAWGSGHLRVPELKLWPLVGIRSRRSYLYSEWAADFLPSSRSPIHSDNVSPKSARKPHTPSRAVLLLYGVRTPKGSRGSSQGAEPFRCCRYCDCRWASRKGAKGIKYRSVGFSDHIFSPDWDDFSTKL